MRPHPPRPALVVALLVALATVALFARTAGHEFVNFDDDRYLTANPRLAGGLTAQSVRWAFTSVEENWHPLTWLSHLADVELFGLRPGGHHLHGALLHALGAALLFAALRLLTGRLWASALVAALFALHPQHVESVAWASERKDVLAGALWMLTLLAYRRYVRAPCLSRYLLLAGSFSLGLMAKPMLVTLPVVLLLLDYWPLARIGAPAGPAPPSRLLLLAEKVPLLALAAAAGWLTLLAQGSADALAYSQEYPPAARLANALHALFAYLGKTLWPAKLAVFYPFAGAEIPRLLVAAEALSLALATVGLAILARRRGAYIVGWLWYLVTLAPVIGIVQVGAQGMADRYTYIPLVGVFVAGAWGLGELGRRRPAARARIAGAAVAAVLLLAAASWLQVGRWRTSVTLFEHAVRVRPDSWLAWNNLGNALNAQGRVQEGMAHVSRAWRLNPSLRAEAFVRTGDRMASFGRIAEARSAYRTALRMLPHDRAIRAKLEALPPR